MWILPTSIMTNPSISQEILTDLTAISRLPVFSGHDSFLIYSFSEISSNSHLSRNGQSSKKSRNVPRFFPRPPLILKPFTNTPTFGNQTYEQIKAVIQIHFAPSVSHKNWRFYSESISETFWNALYVRHRERPVNTTPLPNLSEDQIVAHIIKGFHLSILNDIVLSRYHYYTAVIQHSSSAGPQKIFSKSTTAGESTGNTSTDPDCLCHRFSTPARFGPAGLKFNFEWYQYGTYQAPPGNDRIKRSTSSIR